VKLGKILAGYGTASLVQGATGLLSVPLLIAVLGQRGFASWSLLEPIIAIAAAIALLGAHHGHLHAIVGGRMSVVESFSQFFRRGAVPAVIVSAGIGAAAATLLGFEPISWEALALAALFLQEAMILLMQFQARALSQAVTYAATIWIRSGLILTTLLAAKRFELALSLQSYIFVAFFVSAAVLFFVSVGRRAPIKAAFSEGGESHGAMTRHMAYGMPLVLASVLSVIVATGDRYVVDSMMSRDELPAYVVMAKLGGALSFASAPINLWWPVARHRHSGDKDGGQAFFRAVTPVLFAYYIVAAAALWVACGLLVGRYAPGVAGFDPNALLILLVGGVALGMSAPLSIGTLAPGQTHWTIVAVALSALAGLCSAVLLIPTYGYRGAASATLIAQLVNLVANYMLSQRVQPISLYSRNLLITGICGGALLSGLWICSCRLPLQIALLFGIVVLFAFLLRREVKILIERA